MIIVSSLPVYVFIYTAHFIKYVTFNTFFYHCTERTFLPLYIAYLTMYVCTHTITYLLMYTYVLS